MQKPRIYFMVLILLGALGSAGVFTKAYGQERLRLRAGGGLTAPLSPINFANRYDAGPNLQIGGGYQLLKMGIEPVAVIAYSRYNMDPTGIGKGRSIIQGGKRSFLSGSVGVYYHIIQPERSLTKDFHMYAVAKAGVSVLKVEAATVRNVSGVASWEERQEIKPGLGLGIGLEFPLARQVSLFIEPVYDVTFTGGEKTGLFAMKSGFVVSTN